ncbi:Pcl5p Ecym_3226 [Eremothecium cymbalariae DBVPG|uniref:Cyclin N-terminal domain-containing protein n=1 Tax=Eremothecium cymbalariae (strain CBS 270.75 / DBVPG 7215 / KCTC 17166 / NRRL Y-17582) TaxID=931890 RepID=G8JRF4_ERECY|nr:Hypothetical protein Ecym_3226 [Eremothecium cymbalariae DBVPG\
MQEVFLSGKQTPFTNSSKLPSLSLVSLHKIGRLQKNSSMVLILQISKLLAALTFNFSTEKINNSKRFIATFLIEIFRRSKCSRNIMLLATYYFHKLYQSVLNIEPQSSIPEFARSSKRMFLCCLIIAHKFNQDITFSMKTWSHITGLPSKDISIMERWALGKLEYRLYTYTEELCTWTENVLLTDYETLSSSHRSDSTKRLREKVEEHTNTSDNDICTWNSSSKRLCKCTN